MLIRIANRWDRSQHGTVVSLTLDEFKVRVLWDDGMVSSEDVGDLDNREGTSK